MLGAIDAPLTTLTFDELPYQPVNGLTYDGVTFGYTVGGVASTDAHYDASGPGTAQYVQDPSLEGGTAGVLTLDFARPVFTVNFGLAMDTFLDAANAATVSLYSPTSTLIGTVPISISAGDYFFSSGEFTYSSSSLIGRVSVSFNTTVADRFALDNLAFAGEDEDWYSLTVAAANTQVNLATSTPGGGPGEFQNNLVPTLQLYDPSGNLVATGVVGSDNRNENLSYLAPAAGVYRVHVSGNGTCGEYFLGRGRTMVATTTTIISNHPTGTNYGQSVTFTATVTVPPPGSGTPTGPVTFVDGTTTLGSCPLAANGSAIYTTLSLTAGSHIVTATYSGDLTFGGSLSVVAASVNVAPVSLSVTANPATKNYGSPDPAFTVAYVGFVAGEGPSNLGGTLQFATNEPSGGYAPVGSYQVTPYGLTSTNYTIHFGSPRSTCWRRR